jgi:transposase
VESFPLWVEDFTMRRHFKPPYPAEFRARMVDLVRAGRTQRSLSREFNVSERTIWLWVRQADLDGGLRSDGPTTDEKQELARLRRENERLREERDILKKAAAWFAQEEEAVRTQKKRSDS